MHKILVLEGSSILRMRIIKFLQENGYNNVVGFSSANLINETPHLFLNDVELIITEINLAGISGVEFSKRLNNSAEYCNIPIIFLSAHSDVKTITKALEAGAVDYIVKPFNETVLLNKIKKIIGEPLANVSEHIISNDEKITNIISIEYERAFRGAQPLSFVKIKVHPNAIKKTIEKILDTVRKIDIVCMGGQYIIIIFPMTDEKGLDIVLNKIQKNFTENNIEIIENSFFSITPSSNQSINDLFKKLDIV